MKQFSERKYKWLIPAGSLLIAAILLAVIGLNFIPPLQAQTTPGWPGGPFTDSFERTAPNGWDPKWRSTSLLSASGLRSASITTSEAGVPPAPGADTNSYRQWWEKGKAGPQVLIYNMPSGSTDEGDVFEFEYWLKYDENFDNNDSAVKNIIMRNNFNSNELYIHTWTYGPFGDGRMTINFQQTTDTGTAGKSFLSSNVNGGVYKVPTGSDPGAGEWNHYRWQIKVSTQCPNPPCNNNNYAPPTGYAYGWVNGVKRWDYGPDGPQQKPIHTIYTGTYREINLNSTFNNPSKTGPNQKRYWDLFKIGPGNSTPIPAPTLTPTLSPSPTPTPSSTTPPTFNTPPTITTSQSSYTVRLGDTLTFEVTASDPEGDNITLEIANPELFSGAVLQ